MKAQIRIILFFLSISILSSAQENRNLLNHDEILKWNRVSETAMTDNGQFIVYTLNPWKGDPVLKIKNSKAKELLSIVGGKSPQFSPNSSFVVFTLNTLEKDLHQLKLKKTKKEDFPLSSLGIYDLTTRKLDTIIDIKSYKIPSKGSDVIAYQVKLADDSTKKTKAKKRPLSLSIYNLATNNRQEFPSVSDYYFNKEGNVLLFASEGEEKGFEAGLYKLDLRSNNLLNLFSGKADFKQLTLNDSGTKIAFLVDTNTNKKADKDYHLYSWAEGNQKAKMIFNNTNTTLPVDWEISSEGEISFAPNTNRLFFGIAPIKNKPDTTVLEEDIPMLDVWHWNEDLLQTVQINRKKRDLNKSYLSVYMLDEQKMIQLESKDFSGIRLIQKGDAEYAVAWSNKPYVVQSMYEGGPGHNDFYLVNIKSGKQTQILQDCRANPQVSPEGKYIYWYSPMDTSWNTYNLASHSKHQISQAKTIQSADELNDVPNLPRSYGSAGWLEEDAAFLIYDRYDIWRLDPKNNSKPINLTQNGRSTQTNYRLLRFDAEGNTSRERYAYSNEHGINPEEIAYFTGHNELSRQDGYYMGSIKNKQEPTVLFQGNYKLNTPLKAKNTNVTLFTKENFEVFPDLLISDLNFKKTRQISQANPQQEQFNWGTAELVSWTSLDGRKLDGTLHKPANFDPNKKYPMIVNFYEKSSQGLFNHRIPEPGRSTIDYHYYTSNGYVIFNPDVYYKTGYPGEDAFNCVMPGVTAMIEKGFIDEKHIGAQGHSWGGYQVAYLATRTNIFAAIESGAPVVNMLSAYGGIRWGSGLNRSFQYEHTQSRIGKSIWESPLRYIENSPIFTMDKVTSPILIMHNDDDGSVPWYQGIEYFIALRRLGKPSWLLNYNEADHWPLKIRDRHDFQIRLAQFFNHYLKDQPMPLWMKEGIPATQKGFELGYELSK